MMKLLNSVLCTNYYAWLAGNTELNTNLCLHTLSRRKELMLMIVKVIWKERFCFLLKLTILCHFVESCLNIWKFLKSKLPLSL